MQEDTQTVVITGIGLVTPLGDNPEQVWSRLSRGETAVKPLSGYPTGQGGATVENFKVQDEVTPKRLIRMVNPATCFAIGAAKRAWQAAGLAQGDIPADRFGIYVGCGESEMQPESFFPGLELAINAGGQLDMEAFARQGLEAVDPYIALTSLSNNALCYISIAYQLMGPNNNYVKSGVASSQALGEAMHLIRYGYADAVMVVGVDSLTDPLAVTSYNSVGLLCQDTAEVERAMRPFDENRKGFMPGQGAGAIILESEAVARARGAHLYGRVLGFGQSADGFHLLDTPRDGGQLPRAIYNALGDARLKPEQVDFIIAHGNASDHGDLSEAQGIYQAVDGQLRQTPLTATKPVSGHLGAASGVVESIFALLMLQQGTVPPVLNLEQPDESCSLGLVRETPYQAELKVGMHIARGVGGQNAVLIIAAPDKE